MRAHSKYAARSFWGGVALLAFGSNLASAQDPATATIEILSVSPRAIAISDTDIFDEAATGRRVVGLGEKVYLQGNADEGVVIGGYQWAITSAPGGSATLSSTDQQIVTLRPDVLGIFEITLTPLDGSMTPGTPVVVTLHVAFYVGSGAINTEDDDPNPIAPQCATGFCHGGSNADPRLNVTDDWLQSAHANKLQNHLNGNRGAFYSTACLECHAVGFNQNAVAINGGFDDVAANIGFDLNLIPQWVADNFSGPPPADVIAALVTEDLSTPGAAGWAAIAGADFQTQGNPTFGGHGPVSGQLPLVNVKAAYDATQIFMRFQWDDDSQNNRGRILTFDGAAWSTSGNEDRFYVGWPITDGPGREGKTFSQIGCAVSCHERDASNSNTLVPDTASLLSDCRVCHQSSSGTKPDTFAHPTISSGTSCTACHEDRTSIDGGDMIAAAGTALDFWHWKAQRSDPIGLAEDQFSSNAVRRKRDGINLAPDNRVDGKARYIYVSGTTAVANTQDLLFRSQIASKLASSELAEWNVANNRYELMDGTPVTVAAGTTVTRHILEDASTSDPSASVGASSDYSAGVWTLVLTRDLVPTGEAASDYAFDLSGINNFSFAATDNSGGAHKGVELATLSFGAEAANEGNFNLLPLQLQNLASVQCESCHGPGSQHPPNLALEGHAIAGATLDTNVCARCHDSASGFQQKFYEWNNSSHPVTADISEGRVASISSCLKCHTGEGFVTARVDGETPSPVEDPHSITCSTCHDPHFSPNEHQLRIVGAFTLDSGDELTNPGLGGLCARCHNSRVSDVVNTSLNSRRGAHHGPQSDMLLGVNGADFGLTLARNSAHIRAVPDLCVQCHMADVPGGGGGVTEPARVGGHSFAMRDTMGTLDPGDDVLNFENACASCHSGLTSYDRTARGDYDGDGATEGIQSEVNGLFDILRAGILATMPGTSINASLGKIDIGGSDFDSLIDRQKLALYNYNFIWEDGSFGVHNASYTVQLLQRSYWGIFNRPIDFDFPMMDLRAPVQKLSTRTWTLYE